MITKFRTINSDYEVETRGKDIFIKGNAKYCPSWTRAIVGPIEAGRKVSFMPLEGPFRGELVFTSAVRAFQVGLLSDRHPSEGADAHAG
jgi:hypothetical protein